MTIYKLRDKETGLYSNGGTWPKFTKNGKIWKEIGHLKCHLSQFYSKYGYRDNSYLSKIEVVEFEVIEIVKEKGVILL